MFWFLILVVSVVSVGSVLFALRGSIGGRRASNLAFVGVLGATPLFAGALYLVIGAPIALSPAARAPVSRSQPPAVAADAIAAMSPEDRAAAITSMVEGLAARLETEPDDVDGWRMLARSYSALGRNAEAADALREAVARTNPPASDDLRNLTLLLVGTMADASVNDEAAGYLGVLLERNPNDPMALFYAGMAARERGDAETALVRWRRLKEVLPADAPIHAQLDSLIDELAAAP